MGSTDLTMDEALDELINYLADKPVPPGWYKISEILAQAKATGAQLTENTLTERLYKGLENKTIERIKIGRTWYYRKVKGQLD